MSKLYSNFEYNMPKLYLTKVYTIIFKFYSGGRTEKREFSEQVNILPKTINKVPRLVESEKLATLWGQKKNNVKMTYEKLSRAMRYNQSSKTFNISNLFKDLLRKRNPGACPQGTYF